MDRDLKKKALCGMTGISANTISKVVKGEKVSMNIVSRICEKRLQCTFDDVVEIVPEKNFCVETDKTNIQVC